MVRVGSNHGKAATRDRPVEWTERTRQQIKLRGRLCSLRGSVVGSVSHWIVYARRRIWDVYQAVTPEVVVLGVSEYELETVQEGGMRTIHYLFLRISYSGA
jgi:hypothetical protein